MSDNWSLIHQEVHTFRDYVSKLPKDAQEKAHYCYLLTREEFHRLMQLKGDGTALNGVRIYLGGEMVDGHLVPTIHVIPVEKEGTQYNDYGVPATVPPPSSGTTTSGVRAMAFSATSDTTTSGTGSTAPCPATCSGTNILNS
ncbi:MAG TPA: hypothetical protein VG738_02070 [Chitinophagaceae bacterium]|nr:hypothetical protein [Chitinophagaceae bacterium]